MQHITMHQQKSDQQAPHPTISVQKRMDRFELDVRQRAMHQYRQAMIFMQERLKVIKCVLHLMRRRRHERGPAERDIARADPVLGRAELARHLVGTANIVEQLSMDFPDEPQWREEMSLAGQAHNSSHARN